MEILEYHYQCLRALYLQCCTIGGQHRGGVSRNREMGSGPGGPFPHKKNKRDPIEFGYKAITINAYEYDKFVYLCYNIILIKQPVF
jgi:hypothetical protein